VELYFAYLEKLEEAPILILELQLAKRADAKRKRGVHHETVPTLDNSVSRRTGPWKNGEIEIFKAGVKVLLTLIIGIRLGKVEEDF
jgi:hypothetical protein